MRRPSELTKEELEQVVGDIQDLLYLSESGGVWFYDPKKRWDATAIEQVDEYLWMSGLRPEEIVLQKRTA